MPEFFNTANAGLSGRMLHFNLSPPLLVCFNVNGTQHIVTNPDPAMSLNEWIRNQPGLQGKSHMELNITFGKSHSTAFIFWFCFSTEKKVLFKVVWYL